ncbi:MAG: DNA cytosine methyltransferase [Caulobacteraceae bacterium]
MRTLDLFCGGGGSSWGARLAGAEIVLGVDSWDRAAEAYESNFGEGRARNLRLVDSSCARDLGDIGKIDLLLASPECTNHTCARGNRPLDEDSRKTANHVVSFAKDLKPRWLVIENVVQMRSWAGYAPFLQNLRNIGYFLKPQILNAADFGVPQTRKRLFILGDLEAEPPLIVPSAGEHRSAASILDPEGTWLSRPLFGKGRAQATVKRARRAIAELGVGQSFLIVYYGSDGSGGWQSLDRPLRTLTTLDRFGLVTWRRKTAMLRMLQPPELARAMGLDANYILKGSRRERVKLLGNGVAPPVMQAILTSLTRGDILEVKSAIDGEERQSEAA